MQSFMEMGLSPRVLRGIEALGFEEPTPVQERAIPLLLAGRDAVVQAQTGTGKTAAFGIPIAERIDTERRGVQALVLSPTRELALQVAVQMGQIGRFLEMGVLPIYGGASYDHQIRGLRQGAQVVVATPGRLLDLLGRKALSLQGVRTVIIDEADEMLAMGFIEDVERILGQVKAEHQTALFSATMPPEIMRLAEKHLKEPERVILSSPRAVTASAVTHSYYVVPRPFKIEALVRLLDTASPQLALVFCATKSMADQLARELQGRGYRAEALHGDMTQSRREEVMAASRAGRMEVLVATDVAARGLDVPEITHVVNFDLPQAPDRYVHRIGRTGRAGRTGEAVTIVVPQEIPYLRVIGNVTGAKIERKELPSVEEAERIERAEIVEQVEAALQAGQGAAFRELLRELAQRHDLIEVAAAALAKAFPASVERREIPRVSAERPLPPRPAPAQRGGYRSGPPGQRGGPRQAPPRYADRRPRSGP